MSFAEYVFCILFLGAIMGELRDAEGRAAARHAQMMEAARRCTEVAR